MAYNLTNCLLSVILTNKQYILCSLLWNNSCNSLASFRIAASRDPSKLAGNHDNAYNIPYPLDGVRKCINLTSTYYKVRAAGIAGHIASVDMQHWKIKRSGNSNEEDEKEVAERLCY
jgi:hypothetical protein